MGTKESSGIPKKCINYAEMNIIAALRVYPSGDVGLFCLICLLLNALQCCHKKKFYQHYQSLHTKQVLSLQSNPFKEAAYGHLFWKLPLNLP